VELQLAAGFAQPGIVVQQTWPDPPQVSHSDLPPMATHVFPALHDVPQHGCPFVPHPDELLPALPLDDADPLDDAAGR
jgi:hypothetical protein